MNIFPFVLAFVQAILPAIVGGDCEISKVEPDYSGNGRVTWENYPSSGVQYFMTLNLLDTKTGAQQFYETDGSYIASQDEMTFFFSLDKGHLWKVSQVSCYVVYANGQSDISPENSLTWYIDTRFRQFIPILRR